MRLADGQHTESGQVAPGDTQAESGVRRALQVIGALLVTAFALWFLFGVPAYLLFGKFFE